MDWRSILIWASLGPLVTLLSVFGLLAPGFVLPMLLAAAFAWAFIASRRAPEAPFRTGLLLGLVAAAMSSVVLAVMWSTFIDNNVDPSRLDNLTVEDVKATPRFAIVVNTMFSQGLPFGLLAGTGSWIMARMRAPKGDPGVIDAEAEAGVTPLGAHMDVTHPEAESAARAAAAQAGDPSADATDGSELAADDSEE